MRALSARALLLATLVLSCGPSDGPTRRHAAPIPRITSVRSPSPMVVGTVLRVAGLDLDRVGPSAELVVRAAASEWILIERTSAAGGSEARAFLVTDALVTALGEGTHAVELVVRGDEGNSEPFQTSFEIATSLPLALAAGPSGRVHFEDVVVLHGAGFTTATEGAVSAHILGAFMPATGAPTPIDVRVPMELADLGARDRAVLVLSTDLAGSVLRTGTLHGTIALESTLAGAMRTTPTVNLDLTFVPPELFALDPNVASVGRIVSVRGAGFLGRPGRASETTLLRIHGTFTPSGGAPAPFSMELVPSWASGAELGLVIEARVDAGRLVASLFGEARGVLVGDAIGFFIGI